MWKILLFTFLRIFFYVFSPILVEQSYSAHFFESRAVGAGIGDFVNVNPGVGQFPVSGAVPTFVGIASVEGQLAGSGVNGKSVAVARYKSVFRQEDIVGGFQRGKRVGNVRVRQLLQGDVVGGTLVVETIFVIGNLCGYKICKFGPVFEHCGDIVVIVVNSCRCDAARQLVESGFNFGFPVNQIVVYVSWAGAVVVPLQYVFLGGGSLALEQDVVFNVSAFFVLYFALLAFTTLFATLFGVDLFSSFTGALSMVGNIGPGFNALGPSCNYGFLPAAVKWCYCFAMLAGRLEFYTILIFFFPSYWKK